MKRNDKNMRGLGEKPSPDLKKTTENLSRTEKLILWTMSKFDKFESKFLMPAQNTLDKGIKKFINWQVPLWVKVLLSLFCSVLLLGADIAFIIYATAKRAEAESAVNTSGGNIFSVIICRKLLSTWK